MGSRTATQAAPLACMVLFWSGCVGNIGQKLDHGVGSTGPGLPADANVDAAWLQFETWPAATSARKVKHLLTGNGLTDAEYQSVVADPNALAPLIDSWLATPESHEIFRSYFRKVFQQSDNPATDQLHESFGGNCWNWFGYHMRYNLLSTDDDMWARTVLSIVDSDQPFTQVLTTKTYMMTTAMMSLLAYRDAAPSDDVGNPQDGNHGNWIQTAYPKLTFTRQSTQMVSSADSMNPASASFMNFYDPKPADAGLGGSCTDPTTLDWSSGYGQGVTFDHIFGVRPEFCDPFPNDASDSRFPAGATASQRAGLTQPSDWTDWRLVTIRKPNANENPSLFMNLPALRGSKELVLLSDQAGYLSTLAFLYKWPTNASNQHRVTLNQGLIIGLDSTFAPTDTAPSSSAGNPNQHTTPGTSCYSCHQVLDPMRDFMRQSYNLNASRQTFTQTDPIPAQAVFSFPGAPPVTGRGIEALGQAMAQHPRFAVGWVQKMCRFANAQPCLENDAEFERVVQTFVSSNYNFKVLLRTLFSSPLVTYAAPTKSAVLAGATVAITRRDTFCGSMSSRLHWPDACQLRGFGIYGDNTAGVDGYFTQLRSLAYTVPDTAFARGVVAPAMPVTPDLFFVNATDQLCRAWSLQLVDPAAMAAPEAGATLPAGPTWASTDAPAAEADFVHQIMGIPAADARASDLVGMLEAHRQAALATNASATDALRSTFVVACRSALNLSDGL